MPVVTHDNYTQVLKYISVADKVSLDLETTHLNAYKNDSRIFSGIISTRTDDFYFNINDQPDHRGEFAPPNAILNKDIVGEVLETIRGKTVYIHNAKFDLRFILQDGYSDWMKDTRIICTQALARLVNNRLLDYSLDGLGSLIGYPKDKEVEKYISKHKLYTLYDVGKKQKKKDKHYDLVPFHIISKYGMRDGRVCFELGEYITKRLADMHDEQVQNGLPPLMPLVENEIKSTRVLLKMEHRGVKIDPVKTKEAYDYHIDKALEAEAKYEALTESDFKDSPKALAADFDKLGYSYGRTPKGNPSFSDENLPDNVLGNIIRDIRHSQKLAGTYYRNFLDIRDKNDVIHCNFKQGGTLTGRLSCAEPNLQNVPKRGEDDNPYPVRSCFIPRDGYIFCMIDYDQQEYRLLLDLAGEKELIRRIKDEGLDVHTGTGELCGLPRHDAKQVNFAQVYGQGEAALAESLGKSKVETRAIRRKYFNALPNVKTMIHSIKKVAESRGWIVNPFGRRILCPEFNGKRSAYQIVNHYIQGGCGDIVKKAMVDIDENILTDDVKSAMLLQIHDELLFEIHKSELHLIPLLAETMKNAYDEDTLPLTSGVDYSTTDWYNKKPFTGEI